MKNSVFFLYLTILFCSSLVLFSQELQNDFDFIYTCLKENHPGYHDALNPAFRKILENTYQSTKSKIALCENWKEQVKIIEEFLKQFKCSHLRVNYYNTATNIEIKNDQNNPLTLKLHRTREKFQWNFQEIKKNVYLITLPTFDQSILDLEVCGKVLAEIVATTNVAPPTLYIVDIRNNGGGSSIAAESVLEALYGKEKVQCATERIDKDVFVEWRASKQNIENIENFYKKGIQNNYLDDATKQLLDELIIGMKEAYEKGFIFYKSFPGHTLISSTLKPDNSSSCAKAMADKDNNNNCEKKIIVLINGGSGSAALNFIDLITTIEPSAILMGQETGSDSLYMDVGRIELPSKKGALIYPMKVYRGRKRGNNETYKPHVLF